MHVEIWIDILKQIRDGKLDGAHTSFPDAVVFGMKIVKGGVNLLVAVQQYGDELGLEEVDLNFKNYEPLEISFKPATEAYNALMAYQSKEQPTIIPQQSPIKKKVSSAKLFRKKKK